MKKGVNWTENQEENWYKKLLKILLNNTFWWKIWLTLGPIISEMS